MQNLQQIFGNKKKFAALMLALVMLFAVVGGTLAFRDIHQHRTNVLASETPQWDVTLVENFQPRDDWQVTDGEVTKQIAVVNTGDPTNPRYQGVFVRIQLRELFVLAPMVRELYTVEINGVDTPIRFMVDFAGEWVTFPTQAAATAAFGVRDFVNATCAISGATGWFVPTQEGDIDGQYGRFLVITYGADERITLIPNNTDPDAVGNTDFPNPAGGFWTLQEILDAAGTHHQHLPGQNPQHAMPIRPWAGTDMDDVRAQADADDLIRWILGAGVVLLSDWDAMTAQERIDQGPFWIIDDRTCADGQEGWVYWSEFLLPGNRTSNFLEFVQLLIQPNGDFTYLINTYLDSISSNYLFGANNPWTQVPPQLMPELLNTIPGIVFAIGNTIHTPQDGDITLTIAQGQTVVIAPSVTPASAPQNVSWTWTSNAHNVLDFLPPSSPLTVTGYAPGTVIFTARAATGVTRRLTVTVTNEVTLREQLRRLLDDANSRDEADYTAQSWTDSDIVNAIADGTVVYNDNDATDAQMQSAINDLRNALNTLVPETGLRDLVQDAIDQARVVHGPGRVPGTDYSGAGTGSDNPYTPEWLDQLQNAADEAQILLAQDNPPASDQDLREALDRIEELLNNRREKVDTSTMDGLLAIANAKNADDYTTSTWAPFQTALDAANAVRTNPNATTQQVADAMAALQTAVDNLELRGNANALNALIMQADAALALPVDTFTVESRNTLVAALGALTAPVDVSNLNQAQVDALYAPLRAAYDGLVNLTALRTAVTNAQNRDPANYDNWNTVVQPVLDDAIAVLNDHAATQQQVDDALAALNNATGNLNVVGTIGDLETAVANARNELDYTSVSWAISYGAALTTVQNMLVALRGNPNAHTPVQIQTAIAALTAAESSLVLRANPIYLYAIVTGVQSWMDNITDARYTFGSRAAFILALSPHLGVTLTTPWPDRNATEQQTIIDGINSAYLGLVYIGHLLDAIAAGQAHPAHTNPNAWNNTQAYRDAFDIAWAAVGDDNLTAVAADTATTNLLAAIAALTPRPIVTDFEVTVGGVAATGGHYDVGITNVDEITIHIPRNLLAPTVITLTGIVTGENLPNPALTEWQSSLPPGWIISATTAETVTITIPADSTVNTGSMIANPVDNTTGSFAQVIVIEYREPIVTNFTVTVDAIASGGVVFSEVSTTLTNTTPA